MGYYNIQKQQEMVQEVVNLLEKKKPTQDIKTVEKFAKFYYEKVAGQDLAERSLENLYGAMLTSWSYLVQRKNAQLFSVSVFNPNCEEYGWESDHTIVEIQIPHIPFALESLRMALSDSYVIHLMVAPGPIVTERDASGKVIDFKEIKKNHSDAEELIVHFEINRISKDEKMQELKLKLEQVLADVQVTVADWGAMKAATQSCLEPLQNDPEAVSFLNWIYNDHFTYLGVCDYLQENGKWVLDQSSCLGLAKTHPDKIDEPAKFQDRALINMQQMMYYSTVHRFARPYRVAVKTFDEKGSVKGERHFYGLFTSMSYHGNLNQIPFVRNKIKNILKRSGFEHDDHDGQTLLNILETSPRDEIFQSNEEDLFDISMGIMHLHERARVRLFIRKDYQNRYFSCLVFVPRERFSSKLREQLSDILMAELQGVKVDFTTRFSESILACTHLMITLPKNAKPVDYDPQALEELLVKASRTWNDALYEALLEHYGESEGIDLYQKYEHAFPAGYMDTYDARIAVHDIEHIEKLKAPFDIQMNLYKPLDVSNGSVHFKVFIKAKAIPLSDVLPLLENLGFNVLGERSNKIKLKNGDSAWISEFLLNLQDNVSIDVHQAQPYFQEVFEKTWRGECESDHFNALAVLAGLNWREISLLRAYAKYFKQIGFRFSQPYIEQTLCKYPEVTRKWIELFHSYFDPALPRDSKLCEAKIAEINKGIDSVSNLDEDRILRCYLSAMQATLRTNFYQKDKEGELKKYISIKFRSKDIPEMPLPYPAFEIFVYSPWVEAVHLRGAKVARGGLRWSDRREDFRTEVLGLMKAQQVKNALIVPAGAKGGFVPKRIPAHATRDEIQEEAIRCYQTFICGLLDITDNRKNNKIINPVDVVIRNDDDGPYLVVAADKGTATFSDIANKISAEYEFWLGDAFASGGSQGYDHKKMGITAKGAWESVKQHFSELGRDIQKQDFTVVGIGDMSGDVFGNGMLLSPVIKLVAAFNHQHIFLDPNPNIEKSFAERQRLFNLPRSAWSDYNADFISEGGGVYSRSAKSIPLSPQVKALLDLEANELPPNDLIRAILKAPVDLLWNGGIGTYVKSESETALDVGDRTNDPLRINGRELRCKVVGEGGNLGLTQLGRIEYALSGGILFTDFIDNAGGVNCSDHEVNLKILLNKMIIDKQMTFAERNDLLLNMTDAVSDLVLNDNYQQIRALSLAASRSARTFDEFVRFMLELERDQRLSRSLEYLPNDKEIARRKAEGLGFTRPELAVLLSYSKNYLKGCLIDSSIVDESECFEYLSSAFPRVITEKYSEQLGQHGLRREIIATQLANVICNRMGPTFVKRIYDETGAQPNEVARSYLVASEIFSMNDLWEKIDSLTHHVAASVQSEMMVLIMRLIRRATRWFLRNRRIGVHVKDCIQSFKPHILILNEKISDLLAGEELEKLNENIAAYVAEGVPRETALRVASCRSMVSAMDIIEAAFVQKRSVEEVARVYFAIGAHLNLDWFRARIAAHEVNDNWDALARAAYRDDVDRQQRSITESVLHFCNNAADPLQGIQAWAKTQTPLITRWQYMLADLRATTSQDFTMFAVALRELLDLAQASQSHLQSLEKSIL